MENQISIPIVKVISSPFTFLDKPVKSISCKFIKIDSTEQQVLTCDLFTVNEKEEPELIYQDKAYVLGTQPFSLSEDEIKELKK